MIELDEALRLVIENAGGQPTATLPLEECHGLVLAESVVSDLDSPPFDKSMMDGFAVHSADIRDGIATLKVVGTIAAGDVATLQVEQGTAIQIMTGAPMPAGADSVVIVEKSKKEADDRITLNDPSFRPGQNIIPRAQELKKGETVLQPGKRLGAAEMGLLATVGHSLVRVKSRPTIAILATGDEIVPPNRKPGPAQIRNSNEATILSLSRGAGADVWSCGIARDEREDIRRLVVAGLDTDILILSGGVSAGKWDLVPSVLEELGVQMVFHKVAFKPGKPVWFGKSPEGGLVFGLPGNPVSVYVCFELFVKTALRKRCGIPDPLPIYWTARLAEDTEIRSDRTTYFPAKYTATTEGLSLSRLNWSGSADMRTLTDANCFAVFPISEEPFRAGTPIKILPIC